MAQTVYLPKVGMTMEEGTLCRWLAPDGASVSSGQPLFEMETEKVQMEVEADGDGILKQLVEEGTKLKPGDVVGCLLAPGEGVPDELLAAVNSQLSPDERSPGLSQRQPAPTTPGASPERLRVSPVARRLAQEAGIDLSQVPGTGPDGRIVEQDVRRYIDARAAAPATSTSPAGVVVPYAGRRRTIGERMVQSLQHSAQLTLSAETPVGEAMRMVHGLNREWRRDAVVVTLTAVMVRASALALREHPQFNSRLEGESIHLLEEINVGIAVDLPEGLIVPVVAQAARSTLKEVARKVVDLTERAKAQTLTVDDVGGGTFTLTSLEPYAVDAFTPIINPPQTAILGVGRVREVPAFDGPQVVRRQVVTLSLSFDHRVADGAPAARFLTRIGELLERPYLLM